MWTKASKEKFEQYGITIDTQRQLEDGEYIMHMELTEYPEFVLASRPDVDVKWLTNEQMDELLALEPASE